MDPDPGGPKHVDPVDPDPDPQHCLKPNNFLLCSDELVPAEDGRAGRLGDKRRVRPGAGAALHAAPARTRPPPTLPHQR